MTSFQTRFLLGAIIVSLGVSKSFAATPVAYTGFGAQFFLDTYNPANGTLARQTPVAQNGTTRSVNNGGTPFTFSPDGKTAYIAAENLEAVDVATGASKWQVHGLTFPALATSADGSLLYVTGGISSVFAIFNAATGHLTQTVSVPPSSYRQILVKPDNSQIFLSGSAVVVLNGSTYQVITQILPSYIENIALSPDGSRLYVGAGKAPYIAAVVDTSSDQVIAQVSAPGLNSGGQITVTPDGRKLLLENGQGLVEIATATNQVTSFVAFSQSGVGAPVLVADNRYAYYAIPAGVGFYQFDLAADTVKHVTTGGLSVAATRAPDGAVSMLQTQNALLTSNPLTGEVTGSLKNVPGNGYLVLSGDGTTVVGTSAEGLNIEFSLIDTATHKVTQVPPVTLSSGLFLPNPAINSDATLAYFISSYDPLSTVSVVDLTTGSVTGSFDLPFTYGGGWFLAISPDNSTLYATTDGFMASMFCAISLPANVVNPCFDFEALSADSRPMALSPDGTKLYLPGGGGGLSEFDAQTLAALRGISGTLPINTISNVVYSAAANSVYVATLNAASSLIERVDLGSFQIVATQTLTYPPIDIGVTPDGTEVLIVGGPVGTAVLDGATLAPTRTIQTGVTTTVVVAAQ